MSWFVNPFKTAEIWIFTDIEIKRRQNILCRNYINLKYRVRKRSFWLPYLFFTRFMVSPSKDVLKKGVDKWEVSFRNLENGLDRNDGVLVDSMSPHPLIWNFEMVPPFVIYPPPLIVFLNGCHSIVKIIFQSTFPF